jgi:hypothetical protein
MALIENAAIGVSFEVPDRLTVRQQLRYWSEAAISARPDMYERYWNAARTLIKPEGWTAPGGLTVDANLDDLYDPELVTVIRYVGMAVFQHVNALESVPKA